jgi:hypothetical protein
MIKKQSGWALLLMMAIALWQTLPASANALLQETTTPAIITQINQVAPMAPQVQILSPQPEEVLNSTDVAVQLRVTGTPIFKNATLGLGPHLHLLLDRVPTQSVYDLNAPITLSNLAPGTHTLQVLANKPWHESWKNSTAFAQVTFHVIGKSGNSSNAPATQLISAQPSQFGAEPFLLDFFLVNPPSHPDPQHPRRQVNDWRINVTINESSFVVDRWQPFYLKGLKPGNNLLKLEYLNAQGQLIDSAIRVINYQPNGNDGFSQLLRNELTVDRAVALFDPQSRAVAAAPVSQPAIVPSPVIQTPAPTIPAPTVVPVPVPVIPVNPVVQTPVPVMPVNPVVQTPAPVMPVNPVVQTPAPVMPVNPVVQTPAPVMPVNPVVQTPAPAMPVNPVVQTPLPAMPVNPIAQIPTPTISANPVVQSPVPVIPPNPIIPPPAPAIPNIPVAQQPVAIPNNLILPSPAPVIPIPIQPIAPKPNNIALLPKSNPVAPNIPKPDLSPAINSGKNEVIDLIPEKLRPLPPQQPGTDQKIAKSLSSDPDGVVEFKVIWQELFHTLSVRVKQFTNQIPSYVAQRSQDLGHWLSDRMAAMRQPATAPVMAPSSPAAPIPAD